MKYQINKVNDNFYHISKNKNAVHNLKELFNEYDLLKYKYIYKGSQNFRILDINDINDYCKLIITNDDYTEHFEIIKDFVKFFQKPLTDIKYLKKIKIK